MSEGDVRAGGRVWKGRYRRHVRWESGELRSGTPSLDINVSGGPTAVLVREDVIKLLHGLAEFLAETAPGEG